MYIENKIRSAFTLLEMLFVIVVIGIIANIGVDIFKDSYITFLKSGIENRVQTQTSLLTKQIQNLLENRIRESVIVSNAPDGNFKAIFDPTANTNVNAIEWISVDYDGWLGRWDGTFNRPTWSGFIDLNHAQHSPTKIVSPGTDTAKINALINSLSQGTADINNSVLIFIGGNSDINVTYGWHYKNPILTQNNNVVHRIQADTNVSIFAPLNLSTFSGTDIYEFYQLAWTAKALVVENDGNLSLYENYQPWEGEIYTDGTKTLMMENIDTLQFRGVGDILKFQLCITTGDSNSPLLDGKFSFCKEQAVF